MKLRIYAITFLCVVMVAPVLAGDRNMETPRGGWCSFGGTWFGYSEFGPWTVTMVANSFKGGTHVVELTGGTGSWFGLCEGSVRNSNGLGVWKRTGPRSFEFTTIAFSIDIDGLPVCIWKYSGWSELNSDCSTGSMNGSFELFSGDENPFEDEPFHVFLPGPDSPVFLMTVDPWVE